MRHEPFACFVSPCQPFPGVVPIYVPPLKVLLQKQSRSGMVIAQSATKAVVKCG